MMPFLGQPPPKEYLSPKWRSISRAAFFLVSIALIKGFGENMDMPENPKYV